MFFASLNYQRLFFKPFADFWPSILKIIKGLELFLQPFKGPLSLLFISLNQLVTKTQIPKTKCTFCLLFCCCHNSKREAVRLSLLLFLNCDNNKKDWYIFGNWFLVTTWSNERNICHFKGLSTPRLWSQLQKLHARFLANRFSDLKYVFSVPI